MSAEEYWYGDPDDLANYIHAYNKRRMQDTEQAWLIGQYVLCALHCSPIPVGLILNQKDIADLPPYPPNPAIRNTDTGQTPKLTEEEMRQRKVDLERIKLLMFRNQQQMAKL